MLFLKRETRKFMCCGKHNYFCFFFVPGWIHFRIGRGTRTTPTRTSNIYSVSDIGIGKGVSHESLLDPKEKDRNGSRTLFVGKADQNLVSESADEIEERNSSNKRIE